ncbi:hypothetical protein CY35_10G041500 [Sphagnum magellanicum]|nr:hypothetical protein CY35_10G041500 [Sphagnum magellanicum]KAH9549869.1 hypothetical protein CY35_10G041500 [Sphagnum magellanicum]
MPSVPSRRSPLSTAGAGLQARSYSSTKINWCRRALVFSLVSFSVLAPIFLLDNQNSSSSYNSDDHGVDASLYRFRGKEVRRRSALEQLEVLFPKEVLDIVVTANKDEEAGPLNLNIAGKKDFSSSWVLEETVDAGRKASDLQQEPESDPNRLKNIEDINNTGSQDAQQGAQEVAEKTELGDLGKQSERSNAGGVERGDAKMGNKNLTLIKAAGVQTGEQEPNVEQQEEGLANSEQQASEGELSDATTQQAILSHDPARIAQQEDQMKKVGADALQRTKKLHIKDYQKALADCNVDSQLPRGVKEKTKAMGHLLERAQRQHYDKSTVMKKLRAMLQSVEDQARRLQKHSNFLNQLAAKNVPKGLHCLSMCLMVEYHAHFPDEKEFVDHEKLEDPCLYHYAIFSDNILAAGVVVNSTVFNAKEPEKHVFHVVTDKLNYGAMKVWFLVNPPGKATIHVQNVDDFKWLNSSYCPVLQQLESATMKEYYFKADHATGSANLKFRNPKYLSVLNHLRFYLPKVFPKLDKILFLDDDVVVQKDLTPLWDIDLSGKVNGAVETCGPSFHRFDKYLNFSDPHISQNFDPHACGWAYGMNMFDLKEWKKKDITGIYHRWQSLNEDRNLWKLGTLPPGLITFYNLTYALDKSWHVLGLGYNPNVALSSIMQAAVIHYNGNMKPWLEIAITKYKPHWSKYVKFDHPYLQQCNINE